MASLLSTFPSTFLCFSVSLRRAGQEGGRGRREGQVGGAGGRGREVRDTMGGVERGMKHKYIRISTVQYTEHIDMFNTP